MRRLRRRISVFQSQPIPKPPTRVLRYAAAAQTGGTRALATFRGRAGEAEETATLKVDKSGKMSLSDVVACNQATQEESAIEGQPCRSLATQVSALHSTHN